MPVVFLPSGRLINNPDTVKLVHIIRNEVYGKVSYVISVKLDDDSELIVDTLAKEDEALALAELCTELINAAEEGDVDFGDDDDSDDDDSDADDDSDDDSDADDDSDDDSDDDWDDDDW